VLAHLPDPGTANWDHRVIGGRQNAQAHDPCMMTACNINP
jgi:hypothetical protein